MTRANITNFSFLPSFHSKMRLSAAISTFGCRLPLVYESVGSSVSSVADRCDETVWESMKDDDRWFLWQTRGWTITCVSFLPARKGCLGMYYITWYGLISTLWLPRRNKVTLFRIESFASDFFAIGRAHIGGKDMSWPAVFESHMIFWTFLPRCVTVWRGVTERGITSTHQTSELPKDNIWTRYLRDDFGSDWESLLADHILLARGTGTTLLSVYV